MRIPKRLVITTLAPVVVLIAAVGFFAVNRDTNPEPNVPRVAVTEATLSPEDRQQILDAVMMHDVTVPPGTQLEVDFTFIAGDNVEGTFIYNNGLKGTYTAEKRSGRWGIVDYKKE